MANYSSSIRRIRRSEKSRQSNQGYRSKMKTAIKNILATESKEGAQKKLDQTYSLLDKLASKGIIHRNKAANQKSRLALHVKKL